MTPGLPSKQFATTLIVAVLLLNIETVELALFINAIGIDLFLLLIEVQLAAMLMATFHYSVKPLLNFYLGFSMHPFIVPTWAVVKKNPRAIAFVFPPGAVIMFMLCSATIAWLIYQIAN